MEIKEAIKRIEGILDPYPCAPPFSVETCKALEMAIDALKRPEIIHCKDCKFYIPMNRETKSGMCSLTLCKSFGDDWFCAGAERKNDDCI